MGRVGTLCAETWVPQPPRAGKKHTAVLSERGPPFPAGTAGVLEPGELPENWKKSQHCSLFTSFVLDIYVSRCGKLAKAAGVYAPRVGSGVKGEQVQRRWRARSGGRWGIASAWPVPQLVPKAGRKSHCCPGRRDGKESGVQI